MVELIRRCIGKRGVTAMVLMDISQAYDCLSHDLLAAKLEVYDIGIYSLRLIYSYLTDSKQKVKVGTSCGTWKS